MSTEVYTTCLSQGSTSFYLTSLGTTGIFAPLPDCKRKYPTHSYSIEFRNPRALNIVEKGDDCVPWLVRRRPFRRPRGIPLVFFITDLQNGEPITEEQIERGIVAYGCRLRDTSDVSELRYIWQALTRLIS